MTEKLKYINKIEKIDPEIKIEWLRRLRSGNYNKIYGKLRDDNENYFCALGLFIDIVKDKLNLDWYKIYSGYTLRIKKGGSIIKKLPGSTNMVNNIDEIYLMYKLSMFSIKEIIDMNDKYKKSFNEIADWIEINM